jgi:hypothetical protein
MNAKTLVENRLTFPVIAFNGPFTTTLSFPPMFPLRLWKTGGFYPVTVELEVKTFGG